MRATTALGGGARRAGGSVAGLPASAAALQASRVAGSRGAGAAGSGGAAKSGGGARCQRQRPAPQPPARPPAAPRPQALCSSGGAARSSCAALRHAPRLPALARQAAPRCAPPHARRGASSAAAAAAAGGGREQRGVAALAVVEERIEEKELHEEASESYLAYAMSVIVGRALPDVRDGLKPVHRRILYAMHDLGIAHGRPYKKCARVVGEVLGKYHPHGDAAVYDALVRLAQDFSMSLPLVSGHGNFGSLDDDPPAAMRYTECRLAAASEDMLLSDLEADTEEPLVLPARVPHLLVNGAQGIAVGIATKIPPHNLGEVVAALRALVARPDISTPELMAHLPAPDFPTGGEVLVGPEAAAAYDTGNGSVLLRATAHIEHEGAAGAGGAGGAKKKRGKKAATPADAEDGGAAAGADGGGGGRALVVFTEMPYQVCKSDLVQRIAELVEAKALDGVADVRDESDRTGVRLVVEVRRGFSPELVLNQLYKNTRLQLRFAANMVALVDGVPRTLTLRQFLQHWLDFRVETIERRARHRLGKAEARLHLVQGLLAALAQLDAVVQAIRAAADGPAAKAALVGGFGLSEAQAEGVLAMTLRRLTGLEAGRLRDEAGQLEATIADLQARRRRAAAGAGAGAPGASCCASPLDRAAALPRRAAPRRRGGRQARPPAALTHRGARAARRPPARAPPRAAALRAGPSAAPPSAPRPSAEPPRSRRALQEEAGGGGEVREEDVVPNTPSLVTVSSRGYIKRMPSAEWEAQRRGGKGKSSGKLRDNDALEVLLSLTAHDSLLFISAVGRAHSVRAHRIPEASRASSGSAIAQARARTRTARRRRRAGPPAAARRAAVLGLPAPEAFPALLPVSSFDDGATSLALAVSSGGVKRTRLDAFAKISRAGLAAIKLSQGEELVAGGLAPAGAQVVLASSGGLLARFRMDLVRESGRTSGCVKGIRLKPGERLVAMTVLPPELAATAAAAAAASGDGEAAAPAAAGGRRAGPWLLLVTRRGLGKRVPLSDVPIKARRGPQGVIGVKLAPGDALAAMRLLHSADDDVVLASRGGLMARCAASDVAALGRAAKGVRVISLNDGDEVQTVAVVPAQHNRAQQAGMRRRRPAAPAGTAALLLLALALAAPAAPAAAAAPSGCKAPQAPMWAEVQARLRQAGSPDADAPILPPITRASRLRGSAKRLLTDDADVAALRAARRAAAAAAPDGATPPSGPITRRRAVGFAGNATAAPRNPANVCWQGGKPLYNQLSLERGNTAYLAEYPYNAVVKIRITAVRNDGTLARDTYECTATAISDIVLVTSAHCVMPDNPALWPRVVVDALYGYDGAHATAGRGVSRCVAFFNDDRQADNAIIVLKQPLNLPRYMGVEYVKNLPAEQRLHTETAMLAFPADRSELRCFEGKQPYLGMVESRGMSSNLNYRKGFALGRCGADKYSIWATGSMIGGESGGCLVHTGTGCCIGTASYTCEDGAACSDTCPNAWGGFNPQFPLSKLWDDCLP
ncbi:gyrA [Scenedesmus sp. PABB004]|nr:gyrA [Scenedesmus sp. PABB004]